ncbi:MAG TPA: TraR/DksA C4-type zinc finger protein [Gemmatimonadales bacterium]|nr:TraR/DksA C4-type zinc finger protein [Gemmatimonadales bacterium]
MSTPTVYHERQRPPPLAPDQLAKIRRELEQELYRIIPETRGRNDVGFRAELAQTLSPRPRGLALQIIDALRRMEAGTFGLCAGCDGSISYERLSAIPETTVCAECSWSRERSFHGRKETA